MPGGILDRHDGGIYLNRLKGLALVCLVLLPIVAAAADYNYGYPIPGSYEATIMGTPNSLKPELPDNIPTKHLLIEAIPGLKKPDIFFYDKGLRCTLAYQNRKAPLIFLIPGTGGSDGSPKVMVMMRAFYKAGYHVIAMPSPSHPNFIIAASHSHVPGDLAEDAADLYRVMEILWSKVKEDIEVSDFSLCGSSLGGTQAAFVAMLDEGRKSFNFRKVLMVNPAVNLYNSVTRIEGLLDRIPGGPRKIGIFFNRMLSKFTQFYHKGDFVGIDDEFLYAVYASRLFSHDEAGGLIGLAFRINLAGMVFASDVMTNSGYVVPKNRALTSADPLGDYFTVSVHLSFIDYFHEYFYPYFQKKRPGLTKEALIDTLGLKSIEGYLKSSDKFGAMTNADDFILAPGELDYLRELFGERLKVYPRGGHLGNLEYRDNMDDLIGFFDQ
ncbi:MAG: Alpha/beta hydrolase family protein [Syntrophorhabdus sp. PtaU1.Bin153]|nr:MAG: Alpha/beta hydrolase family protein [Syntrophorhabdus sp. PtaU1.Bin153]